MAPPPDRSQRIAARVVGFVYLFAMAASIVSESYIRGSLIVSGDAVTTARNIVEHATLFRVGIVLEVLTFVGDVTLITALYVILAPVDRHLALYGTLVRMVAAAVSVMMAAGSLDVPRILSGAPDLDVFDGPQLAALARLSLGAHGSAYTVAFVFLGLGSAVFAVVWFRSRYVPRAFAVLGVAASLLLASGNLAILLEPSIRRMIAPTFMAPMFVFEVGMGLLLLLRGIRAPR